MDQNAKVDGDSLPKVVIKPDLSIARQVMQTSVRLQRSLTIYESSTRKNKQFGRRKSDLNSTSKR